MRVEKLSHEHDNTEQRILNAAIKLFATRGYAATGIRPIADAAGVTTSSMYYYARTKSDLLISVMSTGLGELLASGREVVAHSDGPFEQIRGLIKVNVTFGASNPERARVIDNELQWLRDEGRSLVFSLRDSYEQLWADAIASGVEQGKFHVRSASLARLALIEMCNGLAHWYHPNGAMTLDEIIAAFEDMASALLRTDWFDPKSSSRRMSRSRPVPGVTVKRA